MTDREQIVAAQFLECGAAVTVCIVYKSAPPCICNCYWKHNYFLSKSFVKQQEGILTDRLCTINSCIEAQPTEA